MAAPGDGPAVGADGARAARGQPEHPAFVKAAKSNKAGTVFALDSSGKAAGVCVLENGVVRYEKNLDAGRTHSETLLPLAIEAFEAAGLAPADVDLFAVTAGPGSFTGLRIGMSLVKGLALPAGTPAVGVSTLEALAEATLFVARPEGAVIVPALDARRSEVYWAAFDAAENRPRRLLPDTAGPAAGMLENDVFSGRDVFFVGDGAEICYNNNNCGPNIRRRYEGDLPVPIAKGAAFAALAVRETGPAAGLRPQYLRLSQAERERRERLEQEHRLRQ
ncbi:tRNA (adenosine(37)-N6)-threonylcarbamoyltransferase complex dimerization subunit type 1 TsaB [Ruminococcaceae bacterium OttesenSCG-928-D13]|nr:tRNA (adenosine(37)-N6)-threonylcarbamoyltransferase complex dimerization subunit type 1 TsaB [Ruminococcaceae bacterium OttesenSCG-928-D13]